MDDIIDLELEKIERILEKIDSDPESMEDPDKIIVSLKWVSFIT